MADRPKLPYIDLVGFKGLFTKTSPDVNQPEQLRIAENCDFFKTYGAIAKLKGNSRGRIESDGTITTLASGRTKGLFHSSDRLDRFHYITNYDPILVGRGDDMVKYDGAVITNWGITPPGSEELVIDTFDDASSFTSEFCTLTDEPTPVNGGTTWDGDAMQIDKTTQVAGSHIFKCEKEISPHFYVSSDFRELDQTAANRLRFQTYIPRGQLTDDGIKNDTFNQGEAAMAIWVSPDKDTVENRYYKFYYQIGELVEGWNSLNLNFSGDPTNSFGDFYPQNDAIKRVRWDWRLGDNTMVKSDLRLDRFVRFNEGAPFLTAQGSGTFTGNYQYKVTYINKYGHESNAGPASQTVAASSHASVLLTKIPKSTDPQVTARRLYRTVANGSVYLFLDTINNNSAQEYTDTTPDLSLGNTTPPQAGDFGDDNAQPPKGGVVKRWKKTLFVAGDPQNPETLYYSEDNEPESFPLLNAFELDSRITAMYETYSTLIVETENGKWQVVGDNPDFSVDKLIDNMGCVGRRAAGTTRMTGYAVDRDGLRLFDGSTPAKISEPIRDKYDALNKTNVEFIHTVHSQSRNIISQWNPGATLDSNGLPEYSGNFTYVYGVDDPKQGYWMEMVPNTSADLNFLCATEIEDANGDHFVYAGGDDGMVYKLYDQSANNWTKADGTSHAVKTKLQTPYLRLGEMAKETTGSSGRVRPRFVELRVKDNTACTWTVTLESADGSSQETARDSQALSMEFGTNNSLIRNPVKNNFVGGEFLRLTVENEETDVACTITGIRVYFNASPFEGAQMTVATA
jgi:hypothetical protein